MKNHPTFGLIAWLESTRIHLPLKAVECEFDVTGSAVNVQIDQIFHQSAERPLDVTYSFPLPSRAAVYRCEMIVNDRVIRARVEERETARRLAAVKKGEGRRTALVEMERGNLFTLSLGNVQPGDLVVIRLAYFEELDVWKDELALQIPFTPGVRYIPGEPLLRTNSGRGANDDTDQVPDASRITPPRIDQLHPDAARLSLTGRLDGRSVDLAAISSPSHPTAVRPCAGSLEIFLPAHAVVPDRDFILRWQRAQRPDLLFNAWFREEEGFTHALVELGAGDDPAAHDSEGADIYFLVDRSGSMAGQKWIKTAEALVAFCQAACPRSRIWVTFFESEFQDFAERPLERDVVLADCNFLAIANLGTGGGTELLPALRHVLAVRARYSSARRAHVVLITDGQVGNDDAILEEVAHHDTPVHCFGIDTAVNEAFLRDLASRQRGTAVFLTPEDDLVRPIAILGSRLNRPILTQVLLEGDWELARGPLPDLHVGQTVFAAIRRAGPATDILVSGLNAQGLRQTIPLDCVSVPAPLPRLLWTKARINALLGKGENASAIALAKAANILCHGAAFIAWDEAENVAVARDEVYQPSVKLAGSELSCATPRGKTREVHFFESRVTEYQRKSFVRECADEDLVSELADIGKTKSLLKQLCKQIKSAFGKKEASLLADLLEEWAQPDGSNETLRGLLRDCETAGNPEELRHIISAFLLALPSPWDARATVILTTPAV